MRDRFNWSNLHLKDGVQRYHSPRRVAPHSWPLIPDWDPWLQTPNTASPYFIVSQKALEWLSLLPQESLLSALPILGVSDSWILDFVYLFIYLFIHSFIHSALRAACGILVLWPGIEPGASAVRAPSPNHWTTREFSGFYLKLLLLYCVGPYLKL